MSVDLQMSLPGDAVEYPYRAVSRSAIVSLICFALALIGLMPIFSPLLVLTILGVIAGAVALRAITRYPDEFSGRPLAVAGLVLNGLLMVGGFGLHTYIYLTEVPDGYTRVQFYELQTPEPAEDGPAPLAFDIDGKPVFLKGYIHPSSGSGMLRQFILVPDLGTCCFGGQPRSSDMIEVTLKGGQTVRAGLTKRKLAGQFILNRVPATITDFDNYVFYRMKVDQIR